MQELAEYSAWGSSSKPTLNQKRSPFFCEMQYLYIDGVKAAATQDVRNKHPIQSSETSGEENKSTFHSSVGLFPDSPSWLTTRWKERDQELRLYCPRLMTQFEQSRCTFTTVSYDAVIPISRKQRRSEAFTHQMGFILRPNPRRCFSIQPADWSVFMQD